MGENKTPGRGGGATGDGDQSTLRIAGHRVLDLDDVGTPVGQHRARGRHERELRDLEDAHTSHRLLHLPATQSSISAGWTSST
jgi:hypothetical protein